jgi:hypothetical protein
VLAPEDKQRIEEAEQILNCCADKKKVVPSTHCVHRHNLIISLTAASALFQGDGHLGVT